MLTKENFSIDLTNDPKKISVCARMMSGSDPWITLGMDYNQCLKAFEGSYKEIYLIENENDIAGFVIIQICGTFSGYIQTICIGEAFRSRGYGKKLPAILRRKDFENFAKCFYLCLLIQQRRHKIIL